MINEVIFDGTASTLGELSRLLIRAQFNADYDQREADTRLAAKLQAAELRVQLIKRKASNGDAYELVISSGGLPVEARPLPVDGPVVTVDPNLAPHLQAPHAVSFGKDVEHEAKRVEALAAAIADKPIAVDMPKFLDRRPARTGGATIDF